MRSTTLYVRKSSILLAGTGVRKISSVTYGFSPIKIHYPKSLISRINEVYVFFNKDRYSDVLLTINFIYNFYFAVITFVIVLAWFL